MTLLRCGVPFLRGGFVVKRCVGVAVSPPRFAIPAPKEPRTLHAK